MITKTQQSLQFATGVYLQHLAPIANIVTAVCVEIPATGRLICGKNQRIVSLPHIIAAEIPFVTFRCISCYGVRKPQYATLKKSYQTAGIRFSPDSSVFADGYFSHLQHMTPIRQAANQTTIVVGGSAYFHLTCGFHFDVCGTTALDPANESAIGTGSGAAQRRGDIILVEQ